MKLIEKLDKVRKEFDEVLTALYDEGSYQDDPAVFRYMLYIHDDLIVLRQKIVTIEKRKDKDNE